MATRRQQRVNELIQEELSNLLQRKTRDPRLEFVTITQVEVSSDLQRARVYVTSHGDEAAQQAALEGLNRAAGFLRHELAARVSLRYVPALTFLRDDAWEAGQRIDHLLDELNK